MAWWDSSWNPSNWFSGSGASSGNTPTMMGADFSSMADAGYQVPTSAQMSNPNDFTQSATGGGGMNWAGLSSGLSNLSKQLGGQQSSDSDKLSGSSSVSGTVSGGTLSPAGAGGGASALASADAARQQLGQYLILAAMQGKGRGKSGGGLLG